MRRRSGNSAVFTLRPSILISKRICSSKGYCVRSADRHPYAAGHFGRDVAGRVDHRGQPAVVGGIPQVLRELGPSLVHVRRAAGIARQQAVEDVRAVVALLEIAAVVGNHHLVDLLVVLAGVIGVRGLRGQGVERHALQMVGELHVAVISAISSSEYIISTAVQSSEPCVGAAPCSASSPPYNPVGRRCSGVCPRSLSSRPPHAPGRCCAGSRPPAP